MARNDLISKLYAKKGTALEFNYDSLMAPPLASLIPLRDLEYMNKLVTSIKYASKIDYKESEIKKVMSCYGFQRYASGTHRVVYRHLDIPNIIAKISLNKSSLGDNIREMQNQYYLKPFCTKVFDVYPTGLIGLFERVEPFQSRDEFMSVSGDIFDFINSKIIGKYVVDDIGTASFMNYGIRKAGPYSDISFGTSAPISAPYFINSRTALELMCTCAASHARYTVCTSGARRLLKYSILVSNS